MKPLMRFLALCLVVSVLFWRAAWADDVVPNQIAGEHSTVSTKDGSIRDDALAKYVAEQIKKAGGLVKDVKILINSCYGGGLLDDFQREFGLTGTAPGVPWIGGAASGADEPARGFYDQWVADNPAMSLGSSWTNAVAGPVTSPTNNAPGSIRSGSADDTVKSDLTAAGNNDRFGPNHGKWEKPVTGSGNGGDGAKWSDGDDHHAVVAGADIDKTRHNNNLANVRNALNNVWNSEPAISIETVRGATTQQLKDAIARACTGLNANTQLVLYFDGHGDTHFDIDEWLDVYGTGKPIIVEPQLPFDEEIPLHDGWITGLTAMSVQPGDVPAPFMNLSIANQVVGEDWLVSLNDHVLPLPSGALIGDLDLPFDWMYLQSGDNRVQVSYLGSDLSAYMSLSNFELSSGPIDDIETVPVPGAVLLSTIGLAYSAWRLRRRTT